ncbi:MAG TPA: glycosyltransferase family 39 protein [Gemmatimonadota bacterium]|jgi:4-amino-4-deoxy-L-arabinose transferase-like glycosyltransferase
MSRIWRGGGFPAAFFLAAFLVLARLGSLPLVNPDEGRNAEIAREVAESGSWFVPTYNGVPYLDKPIFYFKAVALSLKAFGHSEAAARLPSALFALALLLILYAFCRKEYGERAAGLAVVVVVTCPLFYAFSRIVIFDMPLAFFVCGAILAGYRAEECEGWARRGYAIIGAAATGFATLVKGPVGFVIPALVLSAYFIVDRRSGAIRRLFSPLNLLVFFTVVLPWFIGVALERPDFPHYGIVEETLKRFTTPTHRRTGPVYYYIPVMFGACFAWSVLFPEASLVAWRSRLHWKRADRLFVVWTIVVVAFFSISQSKLPGYVLTAVVAVGVLTARLCERALERRSGRAAEAVRHGVVVLATLSLGCALLLGAESIHHGLLHNWVGASSRDFQELTPIFPGLAIAFGIAALTAAAAAIRQTVPAALAAFVVSSVLVLAVGFAGMRGFASSNSSKALAQAVEARATGTSVAFLRSYSKGISFYLRRPVALITEDGGELSSNYVLFMLTRNRSWPAQLVPAAERDTWLASRRGGLLLLGDRRSHAALDSIAARHDRLPEELAPGWWGVKLGPRPGSR